MKRHNPKPILVIGLPFNYTNEEANIILDNFSKKMTDYHILIFPENGNEYSFRCFYDKDIIESSIDEIKEYIKNLI